MRLQEPIWIRHGTVRSGAVVPTPEFHHCCEFSIILTGTVLVSVEGEERRRYPGDLFVVSPGLPHDARILKYPVTYITVLFLPSLLIEMAPAHDDPLLLNRFLARQPLRRRLVRLPPALRRELMRGFSEMATESQQQEYGREIRLRTLLLNMLVQFQRWEIKTRPSPAAASRQDDWARLHRALNYLREHITGTIYARDLARATGVSESRLRALFHNTLGTPWGHYLETLRCEQAASLFCHSAMRITESALAAGFQSLGSFNASFRRVMGCSPTAYRRRAQGVRRGASAGTVMT
ncbi:MAG: helix-turn-helix transcriptional regulator [Verrucomicrobia bacterium]|nr:helix-turn-helix transcriptional regulator [Verrucomicrobiota bacterium]